MSQRSKITDFTEWQIEDYYINLFRAQMNKDWTRADKIQKAIERAESAEIARAEERQSSLEQNQEGLWPYP